MALASASVLRTAIEDMPETDNLVIGMTNFADVIGDYMDDVQAGSLGSPGIFTLNRSVFVTNLITLTPVANDSWISNFADAWEAAVNASTITANTVTDPATWTASTTDTNTSSSASTTITTIASAKATLVSALDSATWDNDPALPFAEAIRDATLAFTFNTIGVALPSTPIPVSRSAL